MLFYLLFCIFALIFTASLRQLTIYFIFTPFQQPRSVLAQVQLQHPVPIHTIAFNCNDLEANKFLHQLSADTGGRYHYFTSNGSLPDGPPPFEVGEIVVVQ